MKVIGRFLPKILRTESKDIGGNKAGPKEGSAGADGPTVASKDNEEKLES